MSIEDPEESAFGPALTFLTRRLHYVKDYGNSVLVVVPDNALIGVGRVASNDTVLADRALGLLEVGQLHGVGVRVRGVTEEQSVDVSYVGWCT